LLAFAPARAKSTLFKKGNLMKLIRSLLLALAVFTTTASAQDEVFVFTAIPDQDESRLEERFGAVGEYLSEQLNVDVRYVPVKSYAAAVSAFRNNQVQLAWFGGLTGVQAKAQHRVG
jgi:phosphonate transport system substrate-binding protein